jgi:hypothetical protein
MESKVIEAVQSHQQGSAAVNFALASAQILEAVLLGSSIADAVKLVAEQGPSATQKATRDALAHEHTQVQHVTQVFPRPPALQHAADVMPPL